MAELRTQTHNHNQNGKGLKRVLLWCAVSNFSIMASSVCVCVRAHSPRLKIINSTINELQKNHSVGDDDGGGRGSSDDDDEQTSK